MLDRHVRISQILLLVLVFLAAGKPKSYNSGRLANVSIEDVSTSFTFDKTTIPLSVGTMYKFDIASEGVNYIAACFTEEAGLRLRLDCAEQRRISRPQ
jgi:hypothetical protein